MLGGEFVLVWVQREREKGRMEWLGNFDFSCSNHYLTNVDMGG